jgi:hypothetical protein
MSWYIMSNLAFINGYIIFHSFKGIKAIVLFKRKKIIEEGEVINDVIYINN